MFIWVVAFMGSTARTECFIRCIIRRIYGRASTSGVHSIPLKQINSILQMYFFFIAMTKFDEQHDELCFWCIGIEKSMWFFHRSVA